MATRSERAHGEARLAAWLLPALPAGWVLGTALQLQQAALGATSGYRVAVLAALGLLLAAGWAMSRWRRPGLAIAWLLAGILLGWGVAGWRASVLQAERIDPALEGRDLDLTGVVARMPQHGALGWRFQLDVEQALLDGAVVALPGRIQLGWYERSAWERDAAGRVAPTAALPPLAVGDRWRLAARLKAPHGNLNPHGFDHELWLWGQGIGATGYVRTGARDAPPQRLAQHQGHPVERARQSVRDRILATAGGAGDAAAERRAGIVAALVTGDQNVIEQADWDVFRATGVAHLMSISGLHITMFAWLAAGLVGWSWRRLGLWAGRRRFNPCLWLPAPSAAWVGGVLLAAAYAMFSGWGVPAQRTVLMLAGMLVLRLAGLRWPWWLNWLWACAIVLVLDPWALLQAGFWLSFVAVGILFATDARAAERGRQGLRAQLVLLVREQGVVTIALTPLTLILFGQASVVGFLANLVAIPWVTLAITPVALAGVLWAPLWTLAAWALQPLSLLLQWLASWPGAQVSVAAAPLLLGAAAVAGGVLLALRWPWPLRLAGVPLLLPLVLWQPARPAAGTFDLLAVDVGQGSAVLLRTASHSLLYDAGPRYGPDSDAGHRVLVPLLRALGERLDLLVLSHRDNDHTGGALPVLAAQPRADLLASIEPGRELAGLPPGRSCLAGQRWDWDEVRFEVLHPAADALAGARRSNDVSCVLRVEDARGASVLLAGDIERAQERTLAAAHGAGLRSDALLVPHHGSKTSSSPLLLDAVQPRVALVQAGYRNRFGHPAPAVTARYLERGIALFDSPRCGAMHWRSSTPEVVHCERERAARYWHHRPS
ncbi:MAG TPA: DNA internalization-related competence protein ComEC/Rec2 [Ottowia sp.]|uniref:DNA internalization-related competence protein ComEC/Rec2 n=1 Tax=Ottowia sp. TaxID=1898956 RepID=UPI002B965343|nr:DNA internalization-related competence protein ComEC/Rec2 [Ottowia sp.]HMN21136.1 DNA internalization-related competence protein ComEC/Rec2 [Ottowia sp.]